MKITASGRQITVRESMKELAEKKLAKFDRFFGEDTEAHVKFSVQNNKERVEITISYGGTLFRSEESNTTFANAMDCAIDSLERQMRKYKTKLEKRVKEHAFDGYAGETIPEEETFDVRVKHIEDKPMTVDDAILNMQLLGHVFYVFHDSETDKTAVVYRRNSGGYGLILPK